MEKPLISPQLREQISVIPFLGLEKDILYPLAFLSLAGWISGFFFCILLRQVLPSRIKKQMCDSLNRFQET